VAAPTNAEAARLLRCMDGLGTVRRLDRLHEALVIAYETGRWDLEREQLGDVPAESCLEG
jgi:hypothetical protein